MPAATSAPNVITRMTRVTGSESSPAFPRSSAYAVSSPFCALASPNSPMNRAGWAACASATASKTGSILSIALSLSPRISSSTSADRPSLDT